MERALKLSTLLEEIPELSLYGEDLLISSLSADSRYAAPGSLFLPSKEVSREALQEAVLAGVAAIWTPTLLEGLGLPQIVGPLSQKRRAQIATKLYNRPSQQLFVMGVTGTNGKTTTTFLLKSLFDQIHQPCGLIGTIEYIAGNHHYPATMTTPDLIFCHQLLRQMVQQDCRAVAMEVSSHALDQQRVEGIDFDVAIFTNLTHDHLDYHKTMQEYATAKAKLFSSLHPEAVAIVNGDDPWTPFMIAHCPAPVLTFGCHPSHTVFAENMLYTIQGMRFDLHYRGEKERFYSPLVGQFNLYNMLAALSVGLYLSIPLKELSQLVAQAPFVSGRLERVWLAPHVFVDYAHTPDALKNVLDTLKGVTEGKIFLVFGCGGNRDRTKRPKMAQVAEQGSDYVFVTNDNPRDEPPEQIVEEIVAGFSSDRYECCLDRKEAIRKALTMASPLDTVLIAGKGHERGQKIGQCTFSFDDKDVVREFFLQRGD